MTDSERASQNSFLYPRSRYYGPFTLEYLAFNANLQEFSQKVSYISALETGGKLSPEQAFEQIKCLWQNLKYSKQALEIAAGSPPKTD